MEAAGGIISNRKPTRKVMVGDVAIGGGAPVSIQSMTNTRTEDVDATVEQILRLQDAGCQIIRVAVPNEEAARAVSKIKSKIQIPLVCDIHFDKRLAIMSIENGADKIRINPGNIGGRDNVAEVIEKAKSYNTSIRVGVNSGSLEKDILEKYGTVTAKGLCESAVRNVKLIEEMGFYNMVVSIKASDVTMCVEAYKLFSNECDYPLHLGITEAGTMLLGSVKSSVGLSLMLSQGIGDTIRVSLTADPVEEIRVAKAILTSLGLRKGGVEIVSCPTCGRTSIDLMKLADKVTELTADMDRNLKIAVMGCAVNGPGEAREADIGIAGGNGEGLIFAKGKIIKKVREEELLDAFMEELKRL